MTIAGGTAYIVQRERTLSDIDRRLSDAVGDARAVAADAAADPRPPGTTGADDPLLSVMSALVSRLRPRSNESTVAIVDGAARLSPSGDVDFLLDADTALIDRVTEETAAGEVVRGTALRDGRTLRYVAIPVQADGDPRAAVFVVAADLDAELSPLDGAFSTYTIVAAASLAVVGLVGWFVAGRLLRPIRSLRDAATRITATDVSERIPVSGRDDVSDLTTTVNSMLDRLDSALTGQRRLLDDVGHELKTPITIVRGHLELMDESDRTDVASTRDLAIDELDRMSGLVRDITQLADLQRPMSLARTPTDIAALTERILSKAAALSDHDWVLSGAADVVADVDPDRLTQAMLQLAANAVTHGAASGTIEIGSEVDASGTRLRWHVRDEGPGIDSDSHEHIFERFRRGTVGRGTEGSGLGLAIVAAIAEAHGGIVTVDSALGSGARFTIDIPISTLEDPA